MSSKFNVDVFVELVRVVPEYYVHYWNIVTGERLPLLTIGVPENFVEIVDALPREMLSLDEAQKIINNQHFHNSIQMTKFTLKKRSELLRERLVRYTVNQHQAYLIEHNLNNPQPNEWHKNFPLNEIHLKNLIRLNEPPQIQKKDSIKDYLRKNNFKQQIDKTSKSTIEIAGRDELEPCLSKTILHKIEVRKFLWSESGKEIDRRIQLVEGQSRVNEMIHLAEIIKSIFATQDSKAILLDDVLDKLRDLDSGRIISKSIIRF